MDREGDSSLAETVALIRPAEVVDDALGIAKYYPRTKQRVVTSLVPADAPAVRGVRDHLCQDGQDGCAGDARLYDWGPKGYGMVKPVLWTARNGATISGRVWATKAGPAKQ